MKNVKVSLVLVIVVVVIILFSVYLNISNQFSTYYNSQYGFSDGLPRSVELFTRVQ